MNDERIENEVDRAIHGLYTRNTDPGPVAVKAWMKHLAEQVYKIGYEDALTEKVKEDND